MSAKPTKMNTVKQISQLRKDGQGFKTIAKTLGISKNTVKSIVAKTSVLSTLMMNYYLWITDQRILLGLG